MHVNQYFHSLCVIYMNEQLVICKEKFKTIAQLHIKCKVNKDFFSKLYNPFQNIVTTQDCPNIPLPTKKNLFKRNLFLDSEALIVKKRNAIKQTYHINEHIVNEGKYSLLYDADF